MMSIYRKLILLILLVLITSQNLLIVSADENKTNNVTLEAAKLAIFNHISSMSPDHEFYGRWKDVEIVHSTDLYDITDTRIGYHFELFHNDVNVGYYITGARYDITPILEYSISNQKRFDYQSNDKVYYFNGVNHTSAENATSLLNRIDKNSLLSEKIGLDSLTFNTNPNARDLWEYNFNSDLSNGNSELITSSLPNTYWLGVPHIWQRQPGVNRPLSACGPTSLAMAVQYLSNIGLNVHDISHFNNSESEMINGFYNFLGTQVWGTTSGNMSYLVPDLLNMYMSGWTATSISAKSSGAIDSFKDRVVSSRPPLVMWNKLPFFEATQTWHWQTGSGYRTISGNFEFGIREPDSENNTSVIYYSWVDNQNDFLFVSYSQ